MVILGESSLRVCWLACSIEAYVLGQSQVIVPVAALDSIRVRIADRLTLVVARATHASVVWPRDISNCGLYSQDNLYTQ
jgi:hypothetical protein